VEAEEEESEEKEAYEAHEISTSVPLRVSSPFACLSGNLTDVYEPAVLDSDPNSPTYGQMIRPHWHYTYDASGNQISQSEPGVTSLDPNPRTTTFAYDENGNKVRQTLPDGEVQTWGYDAYGNSFLHKVYAAGSTTAVATTFDVYDTSAATGGRLLGEYRYASDFTPTGTGIAYAETTGYDDKTIDTYDDSTSLPSAEQTDTGRLAQVDDYAPVDGALVDTITHYTYDPVTGQEASISSPEGTIDYTYDPATGELIDTSTDGTNTHYGYDAQGQLQDVHVTELDGSAVDQTTTYAYDPAGNLASVTQPDDVTTVYNYNDLNRLTDELATNTATNEPIFSDHYDLNADGTRQDVIETQYNGDGSVFAKTQTDWSYDADGRMTEEQLVILNDGTGGTTDADGHAPAAYDDVFKFDLANNRVEEDTTGGADGAGVITYTYDSDDQLLTENRTGSNAFAITYGHTTSGVFFKGYDAWGNQIEQHRTGTDPEDDIYTWNLQGNMTSAAVTTNGTTSTTDYTYDSNGVRTRETTNAGTSAATTFYLNDPNNPTGYTKAVEEKQGATAATATVSRSYVLGLGTKNGTSLII
jgi:YD repeat-containing protein